MTNYKSRRVSRIIAAVMAAGLAAAAARAQLAAPDTAAATQVSSAPQPAVQPAGNSVAKDVKVVLHDTAKLIKHLWHKLTGGKDDEPVPVVQQPPVPMPEPERKPVARKPARKRLIIPAPAAEVVTCPACPESVMSSVSCPSPAPAAAAAPVAESCPEPAPQLDGLLIISDPKEVLGSGTPDVKGVKVRVPFLDRSDFKARMEGFLDKPLNEATRNGIVADIVRFYRDHDRPVVDVSLPPQEITGGVLQVLAREGKVGRVQVQGNRWFKSDFLSRQVRAQPGQDIDARQLDNDLEWLNRNPFRQVDLLYAKGSEPGQTDLVLREADQFPLHAYAGYENSGTPVTSVNRLLAGLNWGNVAGYDGQMNYQYMADPAFKWMRAHSGSLIQPLPWRHVVTVFGSYADTHGDMSFPYHLDGFNEQASIRYEVPLPILASAGLRYQQSLVGGFDFKRGNSNLAFGGMKVFGAMTDTLQWSLGYNSSLKDPWGETMLHATLFYSPGRWTDNDTDAIYAQSRADARASYTYGNVELDRTTGLPGDFMLVNRFTFQMSDSNLLASEQLGFGGYDTIRGYGMRVVNADQGYILRTELRTPPMRVLPRLGLKQLEDKFQFLGFFDFGSGSDRNLLVGEAPETVLASVGPGAAYAISTHFSLRADYGWQLHQAEASRPYASHCDIGLVLSY